MFNMFEKTLSKKQCYAVIAPEKLWGFRGHTIMIALSIALFHMRIQFVLTVFFIFQYLRQLLLRSLVIKGKNVLFSNIKFRKSYWNSNKNNNVTCVIGWFFLCLLFIQFNWYKTSQISHFIHHSIRLTLYSPKTYLPYVTSAF